MPALYKYRASSTETAKANGLIPYDYLVTLLEELPKIVKSIDSLLTGI